VARERLIDDYIAELRANLTVRAASRGGFSPRPGPVRSGGRGASVMLLLTGQIALVAGAVMLARAHVAAHGGALDELRLRYVLRGHTAAR
jgi:hypothetical protein